MACCNQREEKSVERMFELVKLRELLEKYGNEIHFLQCFEHWGNIEFSALDAVNRMLLEHPETSVFDKTVT